jgi:probable phosphoglycerate mutase
MLREERWDVIPGAEASEAFAHRVRGAVERIVAAHAAGRVVVFTHAGVIGAVMQLATGSRPFSFIRSDNVSITQVVVSSRGWVVRRFNDTAHLEAPAGEPVRIGTG